jgi:hypothetical protein
VLLDALGIGPSGQQQLAVNAGQAAGQQIGRSLITVAVIVVAVFILLRFLKRS